MTNADYMRSLSNEELIDFFITHDLKVARIAYDNIYKIGTPGYCDDLRDWLNQEVKK